MNCLHNTPVGLRHYNEQSESIISCTPIAQTVLAE